MRTDFQPLGLFLSRTSLAGLKFAISLLLLGFLTTSMVRFAPGFGTDERELDSRLSNAAIDHLRNAEAGESILSSYLRFIENAVHGNLGFSRSLNRPVRELIEQRYAISAASIALGLLAGWSVALLLAVSGTVLAARAAPFIGTIAGGLVLCTPTALLAYLCYVAGASVTVIIALVIFARVFRVVNNLFQASRQAPHITAARASGVSEFRIFTHHVLSTNCADLIALGGTSVAIAVGAAIPAEALCEQAGLGQLAWKAALARDLPLLLTITLLIGAVTIFFNRVADTLIKLRGVAA
jgi:peptide/nickel transport system permease protein